MMRLLIVLLAVTSTAGAVVIRDDVADAEYRVPDTAFPALADMPREGHGVLIAPQWVVTAAHTVTWQLPLTSVEIAGIARPVERVVVHEGYRSPPDDMIHQAMQTGEAVLILVLLAGSDDIAMIRLAEPVEDVEPAVLYGGASEANQVIKIIGKGATGHGAAGHDPQGPNRTELRRAFNQVTSAHDRWFCHVFDEPPNALPHEGIGGNGDSGSPALIEVDGQWRLAGLMAWKFAPGDFRTSRPGRYGQANCHVRLRHYATWIEAVMREGPQAGDQP